MKIKNFIILPILLTLFVSFAVSANSSQEEKIVGHSVGTIAVPGAYTLEQIQEAIVVAALGREWTVKKKAESRVIIQLVHRKYDSTLTFDYDENQIRVYSDSYRIKGSKRKPKDPEGWINHIKGDIPKFLKSLN